MNTGCKHESFNATVSVARFEDNGGFMADIRINCAQCSVPMQFLGLQPGCDLQGAMMSIDGLEARIAITPQGTTPNPLQRMAFGVTKFDG